MVRKEERARNTRGTLRRIWGYLRRQTAALVATVLLVAIGSGMGLLGPYLMGKAIDTYILSADLTGLGWLLAWMLLNYVLGSLGTWLQSYLMAGVAQYAVRDLRTELFNRLQSLPSRAPITINVTGAGAVDIGKTIAGAVAGL